jgi:hypothetical protein
MVLRSSTAVVGLCSLTLIGLATVGELAGAAKPEGQRKAAGIPKTGTFLAVGAASAKDVWAVGNYADSDAFALALAEHWDGHVWAQASVPVPVNSIESSLSGVSVLSPTDAWAVGTYNYPLQNAEPMAEYWNGSVWTMLNPLIPVGSVAVAPESVTVLAPDDVWLAGTYQGPEFTEYTLAEHWNGKLWKVVPTPEPSYYDLETLNGLSATSDSDLWAVGDYDDKHSGYLPLILHSDGTKWSQATSPSPSPGYGADLNAVSADSTTDAWAVGTYETDQSAYVPLVEHWDGSSWSIVPSPTPTGGTDTTLAGIVAQSPSNAWIVGSYQTGGLTSGNVPLIEHWDGAAWTAVSTQAPAGSASSALAGVVAPTSSTAWAVGNFVHNRNQKPLLEHWVNSQWKLVTGHS